MLSLARVKSTRVPRAEAPRRPENRDAAGAQPARGGLRVAAMGASTSRCNRNNPSYKRNRLASGSTARPVRCSDRGSVNGPNDKSWEKQLKGLVKTLNAHLSTSLPSLFLTLEYHTTVSPAMWSLRAKVKRLGVEVTTSDTAYEFARRNDVLSAADDAQMSAPHSRVQFFASLPSLLLF
ncbi:hypothetical protein AURDEDRAFT_166585 [Auricularia subglabra TFB-10046 SS5]|nr:hypothetical protein AURDEDRAFT_166585 [Auricularia subglabra TFB-10046 SS5]